MNKLDKFLKRLDITFIIIVTIAMVISVIITTSLLINFVLKHQ